jgi:hypothetical protein
MSRDDLAKAANDIFGNKKEKKPRYIAKFKAKISYNQDLTIRKNADMTNIIEQYKNAKSVDDEVLADTIMDQIYFLSFRDSEHFIKNQYNRSIS